MNHADRQLMEQFREGDREAFTAIYRSHHQPVFRFALHMTADRSLAVEITQEVFVWLIHHPAEFDPERGTLAAFLNGVARNMVRRSQRESRRWLPIDESVPAAQEAESGDAIDLGTLHRAIAALPGRYREAVVLCDLESKGYEEAAILLGCPVGTVRSRLHRGREMLAQRLRPRVRTLETHV
jgi:RNA polymerase sigma-70 factor (ECF subfamily)